MKKTKNRQRSPHVWLLSFVVIFIISTASFLTIYLLDHHDANDLGFFELLFNSVTAGALSNMPEVIAGLLGIAITVVAIIVELSSNRYTSRITELFVKNRVNQIVLGFFVLTCFLSITISLTGGSPGHVPKIGAVIITSMSLFCILILLPYFAYVFSFLNPHNIIDRMSLFTLKAVQNKKNRNLQDAKKQSSLGVEQLADIALNAIKNKDKVICMHAVKALGNLLLKYASVKEECDPMWFIIDKNISTNPDFVSMQPGVITNIETGRFWFEMKILRQYQMLYNETLNKMRDINYLISINTRNTAEAALKNGDTETFTLAIKFFNTYLRVSINILDERTTYNVFNQYRLLAENILKNGKNSETIEIAHHFQYYGQLGFSKGLAFVLETAAYDLCALTELAFDQEAPCQNKLLEILLSVDREEDLDHDLESSLRGVKKAQIKLATYFLINEKIEHARTIFEDMKNEAPARLKSIKEELLKIGAEAFWEISDRGVNFDYLEPDRREKLSIFFSWFEDSQITNN